MDIKHPVSQSDCNLLSRQKSVDLEQSLKDIHGQLGFDPWIYNIPWNISMDSRGGFCQMSQLQKYHNGAATAHSILTVGGKKFAHNSDTINTLTLQVHTFQKSTTKSTGRAAASELPTETVRNFAISNLRQYLQLETRNFSANVKKNRHSNPSHSNVTLLDQNR